MITIKKEFTIQPIREEDYWDICNLVVANEDRFKTFFPLTLSNNLTPELSQIFAARKVKEFQDKKVFLFTIKKENEKGVIGLIYIKELDWSKLQGEFAYCIGYQYEGKGIISACIKELSNHAFTELGLETLQIISHKSNTGSIKVAEKNGFVWQRQLQNSYTPPNSKPLNMELYELYCE